MVANLAIPTLTVPTVGNFDTGAWWTQNVTNMLTYGLNPPIFAGTQTSAQSTANTTWTTITLDTEQADSYGGHNTATNNSRYVAQIAGWYTVCGVAVFANNATGSRAARLHVNGNVIQGSAQNVLTSSSSSFTGVMTPVRAVQLAVGDYVEVAGWQSSGGSLNTGVASDLASALFVAWAHV
ncbi:hypothetical protein ACWC3Y_10735 [Streptomyces sp. NPDC001296]